MYGDKTVCNTSINARCLWEQSFTCYISCATGTEEEDLEVKGVAGIEAR